MTQKAIRYRSIALRAGDDGALPTEFELFPSGVSPSTHDQVLVDKRAAELVMSRAARHGVDLMIDLNHYSLFAGPESDPSAADARGWFNLAVRDGAIWAVNVTWTEDGAARLRDRRQRYISPAYRCEEWDAEHEMPRLTEVINCALVAMPATHDAAPLVGRAGVLTGPLDRPGRTAYAPVRMSISDQVKAAVVAALEAGDVEAARAALAPAEPEAPAAEPTPAPEAEQAPAAEAPPEPAPEPAPEVQPEPAPAVDVASELRSITGAADDAGALARVRSLVQAAQAAEAAERRSLITSLVELGAETPATAWSNNAPVARLASESLADLRSRVAALRSRPAPSGAAPVAPPSVGEFDGLSDVAREAAMKITDPKHRAAFIAQRRSRSR